MPQVTVYIREEDYPKWRALKKKSEFISRCIALYEQKHGPLVGDEPVYTEEIPTA